MAFIGYMLQYQNIVTRSASEKAELSRGRFSAWRTEATAFPEWCHTTNFFNTGLDVKFHKKNILPHPCLHKFNIRRRSQGFSLGLASENSRFVI